MPRRTPQSYDEITRRTVANPDSSHRPTHEEERLARHRFGPPTEHRPHTLSARERVVRDRVVAALRAEASLDLTDVTVDMDESEVVLIGTVPGPATAIRIEEIAGAVAGVSHVDNQLCVRGEHP